MTRKDALEWIKVYTARGEDGLALRVYIENRVSFAAYREAQAKGLRIKAAQAQS